MAQIELVLNHVGLYISVPNNLAANPKLLDGGHPLYYLFKTKGATCTYLNKVAELYRGIADIETVLEYCGGVGLIPLSLATIINWKEWKTIELDASCKDAYQCPGVEFVLGSMYEPKNYPDKRYDLVFMDFPSNTLPKMWREPERKLLLEAVAKSRPKYWHITDVAYYWIHLANHWPIYQAKFGVKPTRENYHELFDQYMRENYGYKVIRWTVGGGAQYFLMEAL
jgi:hypothetical protein